MFSLRRYENIGTLSLLCTSLTACSFILKTETSQCSADTDCQTLGFQSATCQQGICVDQSTADGGTVDPKWGCVGKVKWPVPDTSQPAVYHERLVKLFGETPLTNISVQACQLLDLQCSSPIFTGVTDANGEIAIKAYKGFEGYARMEPNETFPDLYPALSILPHVAGDTAPEPVHLMFGKDIGIIEILFKTTQDPELGIIMGLATDCEGNPAAGVTIKIDTVSPKTLPYYVNGSLPSATLGETTASGEAGFINVPPGAITLTATHVDIGKIGTITVPVLAHHITYIQVEPTP